MDYNFGQVLKCLIRNVRNKPESDSKGIIKLINDGNDLVTIDTETKCAYFHGDFPRLASKIPHLKPLVEYLEREKYETNLD